MPDASNTLLTNSVIASRVLANLFPRTVMLNRVHRDYAAEFQRGRGATVTIRKPASFSVNEFTGTGITVQDAAEGQVAVTLDKHLDVSFAVTAADMTLNLVDFEQQFVLPAAEALAQKIDTTIMGLYKDIYNTVGTAGTTPSAIADVTNCGEKLNTNSVALDRRSMVIDPATTNKFTQLTVFHQAQQLADNGQALREGQLGRKFGFDLEMSQNVQTHTKGTLAHSGGTASAYVNGAVAAGATTMAVDNNGSGTLTGTLVVGDVFTVANVTGSFVVTAAKTASGNAIADVTFTPAAPSGGFADNAVVTLVGSHKVNLAFHETAFAFVSRPLAIPQGLAPNQVSVMSMDGLGIRVVKDYNNNLKQDEISLDLLCGVKTLDPVRAVRLLG